MGGVGKVVGRWGRRGGAGGVGGAVKDFVAKFGAEKLPLVSKMHFRTSYRALGLPEPPAKVWKS